MGLVKIGGDALLFNPNPTGYPVNLIGLSTVTMNASGESHTGIGYLQISDKAVGKSLVGAKLWFSTGAITFNNGGSLFRIGIQDITGLGVEDGTFDIRKDFTGGGGVLLPNAWQGHVLNVGSKVVSHGDLIAISFELVTRGGPDNVQIHHANTLLPSAKGFPYATTDTGGGPVKSNAVSPPCALIQFADGEIGRIDSTYCFPAPLQATFSTTAESGLCFVAPFTGLINKIVVGSLNSVALTDILKFTIWSDPLGSPVPMHTFNVLGQIFSSTTTSLISWLPLSTPVPVVEGQAYAITISCQVGTVTGAYLDFGIGNESFRKISMLGETWFRCSRVLPSVGPMTISTNQLPGIGFTMNQIEAFSGSSGSVTFG